MKKIGLLLFISCLSLVSFAQNTVDIFCTGPLGSYKTGSSTSSLRSDNAIRAVTFFGSSTRGYGVFSLSSIPPSAVITSVELHFNVETVSPGGGGGWTTRGVVGDLSTITAAATLYTTMGLGTSLYTTTYGTTPGNKVLPTAAAAEAFIGANLGGTVSIVWTTNSTRLYNITGETGIATTTGVHAPFLRVTYNCPGITALAASGPATTPCPNTAFDLTSAVTGTIASYAWTGPLGFASTAANPTVSSGLPSTGNYTLVVTDATGCSAQTTVNVPVFPAPSTTISPLTPTAFCAGGDCTLEATAVAGNTYQWYDNGIVIAGATNTSYTATGNGSYKVEVTDVNGCSAITTAPTNTVLLDTPAVTPGDTVLLCNGETITLAVDVNGVGSGIAYQWQKNGSDIGGSISNSYLVSSSGIYRCQVSVPSTACSTVSREVYVVVNSYPVPVITSAGGVLSTASTFVAYQWFLNTVAIAGATSSTYAPTVPGSYRVRVTDNAGCSAYSNAFPTYTTGVTELNKSSVLVFPNPVNDKLNVVASTVVTAVVTSIDGRVLVTEKNATVIDMYEYPAGLYIINFYNEAGDKVGMEKIYKN